MQWFTLANKCTWENKHFKACLIPRQNRHLTGHKENQWHMLDLSYCEKEINTYSHTHQYSFEKCPCSYEGLASIGWESTPELNGRKSGQPWTFEANIKIVHWFSSILHTLAKSVSSHVWTIKVRTNGLPCVNMDDQASIHKIDMCLPVWECCGGRTPKTWSLLKIN